MSGKSDLIWLICAHRKELDDLEFLLKKFPRLRFFEIGVGMMEAAFRFAQLHEQIRSQGGNVLLAGSAGSIGTDEVGQVALCRDFGMPRLCDEEIPEFLEASWSTESFIKQDELVKGASGVLPKKLVFGSFGISLDSQRYLPEVQGAWENMEAALLSYLCLKNSISFEAVLYCTNRISPEGRKEWSANYRKAAVVLRDEIERLLAI